MQSVEFKYHKVSKWLDIGNVSELNKTRKQLGSSIEVLDKQNESIYFFEEFVVKFFSDSVINSNRVKRANLLNNLVPTIIDSSTNF